jgi:hypothetical protein
LDRQQENGNDFFRTLYWEDGDQIKLYSELNNWRTQKWEYDATLTGALPSQYKKANGFGVFKKPVTVAEHNGEKDEQYKDGYGVMPADLSEFTNEDRTQLKFNLNGLRYINYSQENDLTPAADADADDAVKLYAENGALHIYKSKAPLPLWGVATSGEMKCKWLTGHLCIDLVKYNGNIIPEIPSGTPLNNYLVIQSNQSLWGEFESITFNPNEGMGVAPVVPAIAATPTVITSGTTTIGDLGKDCIVLNLGKTGQQRVIAYAPIMVSDVPTTVTATLYQGAPSTDAASAATVVLTKKSDFVDPYSFENGAVMTSETIEAGKLYRVANPDYRHIEVANTPYSLQTQLADMDAQMERDYVVEIKNDVLVKTANTKYKDMASSVADQHNYVLDLANPKEGFTGFKHNITIKFASGKGFTNNEMNGSDINYLFVKTPAGKKVTIDLGTNTNIKNVVVDNTLAGELILKGGSLATNTNVINYGTATTDGKLTVADDAKLIATAGAMNIDAVGKTITKLEVMNNAAEYTVNLKNGYVATLTASNTENNVSDALGAIQTNVNIASTGKSAIKFVQKDGFEKWGTTAKAKYNFYFSSTWDAAGSKFADEASANLADGQIYTAAQLASINGAAASYTVMGQMDMSAATWKSIPTATANFSGANINEGVYVEGTGYPAMAAAYPTITGMKNPLVEVWTLGDGGKISNVKFSTAQWTSIYDRQAALARELQIAGTVTVDNVDVEGYTITASKVETAKDYAGVIGQVNATAASAKLLVKNVAVDNVAITANKYVGGIIGRVVETNTPAIFFGATTASVPTPGLDYVAEENTVSGLAFTFIKTPNTQADPEYKSAGAYVGYYLNKDANNLVAVGATLPYTFTTTNTLYDVEGRWGTVLSSGAYITFDVVMGQKLFGYAGNSDNRKATFVTKSNTNKFSNVVKQSFNKHTPGTAAQTAGTLLYFVDDTRE